MENPYFEKLANFSYVHVNMWWIDPMWPKCAFGNQKGLIWKEAMSFGNPPYHGTKNCGLFKNGNFYFLLFMGQKGVFGVKKWCCGVFWTECEEADLKQTTEITTMDHRN